MNSRRKARRNSLWGNALILVTLVAAIAPVAIAIGFARSEATLLQQLESQLSPSSTAAPSLTTWLEQHASRAHTEAWGSVFNQMRSPYVDTQLRNLFMLFMTINDSDQERMVRLLRKAEDDGVKFASWESKVNAFLDSVKPLREEVHRLCESREVVYIPLLDQGDRTALGEMQLRVHIAALIYLECEDAIQRGDAEAGKRSLRTLDALEVLFHYPAAGSVFSSASARCVLCVAVHRMLDAGMLEPAEWTDWMARLRDRPDLLKEFQQHYVESMRHRSRELLTYNLTSFPNVGRGPIASELKRLERAVARNESPFFEWFEGMLVMQDYQQSLLTRLAVLSFAHQQQRLPMSLRELPRDLLQPQEWTNERGVELVYAVAEDGRSATLKAHRREKTNAWYMPPLPPQFKFQIP